ncbi:MAG: DNA topoisomerase I [Candidatus Micrarchaeota archaeon]|nr:DNA topoisomerase I [Candidatus Micrarchaeota archaeon]
MNTLIIAEKPSVALRVAIALGNNAQKRLNVNGVNYYEIDSPSGRIYVAAAVGHIFTIRQKDDRRGYPVLDVEWAASYEVDKKAYYTKKYLDVFRMLAQKSDSCINACDFDIEGTVIGTNIIKFLGIDVRGKARRMKFSTTTIPDLKNAYENLMPLDLDNFHAGEVRHMLDWLWGINLSRALTSALVGTKFMRPLSIGRVQGPTLALLARREIEISKFVSKPYWNVLALISGIEFSNTRGDIFDKKAAEAALKGTEAGKDNAVVEGVESAENMSRPYPPFDLTALQLEASRTLRLDPSSTLATAQSLYERAYISYPRTSSQKLPPTLGLPRIIGELAKNPKYEALAKRLISERRFRPNEGMKSDEAHPAIYPTGIIPKSLNDVEGKLYDLIAKRFLACFAPYAKIAKMKVTVAIGSEKYVANGTRIIERGWMEFYTYASVKEKTLPGFSKGSKADVAKAYMQELKTEPPRRYGKAGLIAELEKRTLGTKATRAAIIDTLFRRGYIEGSAIKVTSFGMSVYRALDENSNMIVNEETTKKLEGDMEQISLGKKRPEEVIEEGKEMLLEALRLFDNNKEKIGKAMQEGLVESQVTLGKCIKDGGDLVIKRSRAGKQFVACANYPDCTNTYSIPQNALVVPAGKMCEHCHTPIVKVIRKGRGVFEMDLDPECITKQKWREKKLKKEGKEPAAVTARELKSNATASAGKEAAAGKDAKAKEAKAKRAARPRKPGQSKAKPATKRKRSSKAKKQE